MDTVVVWERKQRNIRGWLHVRKVCGLHEEGKMRVSDTVKNGVKKGNPTVLTPYRAPHHLVLLTALGHY